VTAIIIIVYYQCTIVVVRTIVFMNILHHHDHHPHYTNSQVVCLPCVDAYGRDKLSLRNSVFTKTLLQQQNVGIEFKNRAHSYVLAVCRSVLHRQMHRCARTHMQLHSC